MAGIICEALPDTALKSAVPITSSLVFSWSWYTARQGLPTSSMMVCLKCTIVPVHTCPVLYPGLSTPSLMVCSQRTSVPVHTHRVPLPGLDTRSL